MSEKELKYENSELNKTPVAIERNVNSSQLKQYQIKQPEIGRYGEDEEVYVNSYQSPIVEKLPSSQY